MATYVPVARCDDPCPEAVIAAMMTSGGLAEASLIRGDLRRLPLRELPPDPAETSTEVNDKRNPFATKPMADRYLRNIRSPEDVVQLPVQRPGPWDQHADYITARALRVVSQIGTAELPALAVYGNGDGLSHRERGDEIKACLRDKRPFAAVNAIDRMTGFLALDSEDRYASVAIVARNPQHVAVAVATGSTVAVGTHHRALIRRDGGRWMPASELPALPVLHGSIAAPISTPSADGVQAGMLFPEWGNPIMLNGVVLGGVEAAYQPDCRPCDGAAIYIAAAAGRVTLRATGSARITRRLLSPHQIQGLLVTALLKGEKVPGLIAARDELAAHRLLSHLRRCGIA